MAWMLLSLYFTHISATWYNISDVIYFLEIVITNKSSSRDCIYEHTNKTAGVMSSWWQNKYPKEKTTQWRMSDLQKQTLTQESTMLTAFSIVFTLTGSGLTPRNKKSRRDENFWDFSGSDYIIPVYKHSICWRLTLYYL